MQVCWCECVYLLFSFWTCGICWVMKTTGHDLLVSCGLFWRKLSLLLLKTLGSFYSTFVTGSVVIKLLQSEQYNKSNFYLIFVIFSTPFFLFVCTDVKCLAPLLSCFQQNSTLMKLMEQNESSLSFMSCVFSHGTDALGPCPKRKKKKRKKKLL